MVCLEMPSDFKYYHILVLKSRTFSSLDTLSVKSRGFDIQSTRKIIFVQKCRATLNYCIGVVWTNSPSQNLDSRARLIKLASYPGVINSSINNFYKFSSVSKFNKAMRDIKLRLLLSKNIHSPDFQPF